MTKLKFIFTLWFSYFCIDSNGQSLRSCKDCLLLSNCPNAMELLLKHSQELETQRKVKSAHCGYTYQGQQRVPKNKLRWFEHVERVPVMNLINNANLINYLDLVDRVFEEGGVKRHQNRNACMKRVLNIDEAKRVCCLDFAPDKDPIESHPNLYLLPKSCGGINGNRIIGGTVAKIYEYPWMALISHKRGDYIDFGCGGSIINSRYILTAAHCVKNKDIPGVRLGEFDLRYETDCQGDYPDMICESKLQDIAIEEQIVHPKYSVAPTVTNDIALLRLRNNIDFNYKNSKPICLPVSRDLRKPITNGETGDVAGWGVTETSFDSSVLLKVSIPVSTTENCLATYNKNKNITTQVLSDKEFCAGELNKDSCSGDSGGPLMLERLYDVAKRIVQYGVVSRGPRQCGMGVPGIYTDVSKYMDWILDNIKP